MKKLFPDDAFAAVRAAQMTLGKHDSMSQLHEQIRRMHALTKPLSVELFEHVNRLNDLANPAWLKSVQDFDRTMRATAIGQIPLATTALADSLSKFSLSPTALALLDASAAARFRSNARAWDDISKLEPLTARVHGFSSAAAIALGIGENAALSSATVERVLGPVTMLTRLGRRTARLLEAAPPEEHTRIARTLEVIENEVTAHLGGVAAGLAGTAIEETELFAADRPLNLGRRQQDEMLAAPASAGDDPNQLVAAAPTSRIIGLAREAMELVFRINQAAQARGSSEIFKPTNRVLQVFQRLPWLDAHTEGLFGDVVDDLYVLLYEGAGKDNLRFLRAHGGPLDPPACDVIFCIKHLRNKWLRHDPEHGGKKDIEKSYATLGGHLQRLGLSKLPRRAADYRLLQERLLREVVSFLERLLAGLDLVPKQS